MTKSQQNTSQGTQIHGIIGSIYCSSPGIMDL